MLLFPGYMFMFQIQSVPFERKQIGARSITLFFTDFRTAANGIFEPPPPLPENI